MSDGPKALTLRQYYAGLAMQGLIADSTVTVCEDAVQLADDLCKRLGADPDQPVYPTVFAPRGKKSPPKPPMAKA